MNRLKTIFYIINLKTAIIAALSVASTFLCIHFGIAADFPLALISTAIVFPIVFSIGGAYKRREAALDEYGSIKAHGRAIYFAARDWMPDDAEISTWELKTLLGNFMRSCHVLFTEPVSALRENEDHVYKNLSKLSAYIKDELRAGGMTSGEVSRCNQFLSKMAISFENIKHVYQYRTPRTLRAFSDFFIVVLPIVYGPYFAHLAADVTYGLEYFMPVLFSIIFVSLDNIQLHLENPFDRLGEDDVEINVDEFLARLY